MPLPKVVKPIAGLTGLSAASAGGVLLYNSSTPEPEKPVTSSVRNLMLKKHRGKRMIAESESSSRWESGWNKYLSENKDSNPWNLSSGSKNKDATFGELAPPDFVAACMENSKKEINEEDPLYAQVISYCTRNTTIADLVAENASGRELMEKSVGLDNSKWKKALENYKKLSTDVGGIGNLNESTLADKCFEQINVETGDTSSELYKQVLDGCTEDSKPKQA